jgi:hypothetical protein
LILKAVKKAMNGHEASVLSPRRILGVSVRSSHEFQQPFGIVMLPLWGVPSAQDTVKAAFTQRLPQVVSGNFRRITPHKRYDSIWSDPARECWGTAG